tara:strand:+ start:2616 stop:3443 length:828 start_codon:yes stop_codon:yes gene_type:complete
MIKILIKLRKFTNKYLGSTWIFLGRKARSFLSKKIFIRYTLKKIGAYGPFRISPEFLFSDLEAWGGGHNNGFNEYIESSTDKLCILDIGAHVGLTILPLCEMSSNNTKIYGFEPSSRNFDALKFNVKLNNFHKVILENCLVGEEDVHEALFYETDDISATSSIVNNENRNFEKTFKKQVSIDSYCQKNNLCPDLIKIDVEGAEISVLRGAKETMKRFKPIIFLSVHPNQILQLGGSEEDLLEIINYCGYSISNIDGSQIDKFESVEYLMTANKGI